MKKINWICSTILFLMIWQTINTLVFAQSSFCDVLEDFNSNATVLPDGWETTHVDGFNANVQWALSGDDTYCDMNNLVSGQSGNDRALCASSDNAVRQLGSQADGIKYDTTVFSSWLPFPQHAVKATLNYNLHYQSLSDELVFVIEFRDSNGTLIGDSYVEKFSESPDSVDYPSFNPFEPLVSTGLEPVDVVLETLNDIPQDTAEMRISWQYRDTGDSFADWYVQMDNISVACEYLYTVNGAINFGFAASDTATVSLENVDNGDIKTSSIISGQLGTGFEITDVPAGMYKVTVDGYTVKQPLEAIAIPRFNSDGSEAIQSLNLIVERLPTVPYTVTGVISLTESVIDSETNNLELRFDPELEGIAPVELSFDLLAPINPIIPFTATELFEGTYRIIAMLDGKTVDVDPNSLTVFDGDNEPLSIEVNKNDRIRSIGAGPTQYLPFIVMQ